MRIIWIRHTYSGSVLKKTTKQDITKIVSKVTWSGASTQASRQVSLSVAYNPYDKNFKTPKIKPGDIIKIYAGKEKDPRFIGRVPNRQMTSDVGTIEIIAYDYMHNLTSSTMTKKFKNKTPEYIAKAVLKDMGITPGKIIKTKKKIKKFYPDGMSPYDIIVAAYRKVMKQTGKKYFFRMNGTKFEVIEKGEMLKTILEEKVNLTSSNYEENADEVVNKVDVFKKNKKVNSVKNEKSIKKYGILQQSISVDKGKGKKEANNTLNGLSKTASISALGNWNCTAGKAVRIKDSASGLIGKYWITNDTHNFENGIHTMDLDLEFKNVMESVSVQELDTSKKSGNNSGSSDSTEYTTVEKDAFFTAYYAASGAHTANGELAVPSKQTCAAARSLAFNTKFTIKGTGTKYDGKVYRVTDREKNDTINGKIHIDILMNNYAECAAFGTKTGKILIQKKKRVSSSAKSKNSTIDKVIAEAKSWIGRLSYSQARRQCFYTGGSADCSSFAHHCYAAVGIEIGSTTADQPTHGTAVSFASRKRGDLVFFHTCSTDHIYGASHVGIVLNKDQFIHCSSGRNGIAITNFASYHYPVVQTRRIVS